MNHFACIYELRSILNSWTIIFDQAESARKIGIETPATKSPPYLHPFAEFDASNFQVAVFASKYSRMAAGLTFGKTMPEPNKDGRVVIPHPMTMPSRVISHSMIVLLFSALERYEFSVVRAHVLANIADIDTNTFTLSDIKNRGFDALAAGRTDDVMRTYEFTSVAKRMKQWDRFKLPRLDPRVEKRYGELAEVRNGLAHDTGLTFATMSNAVQFYYLSYHVSTKIAELFFDQSGVSENNGFTLYRDEDKIDIWDMAFPLVAHSEADNNHSS